MAAKKKAKKKAKAAKTPKGDPQAVAVRVLGQLPALDDKLREAFRASFTNEQCEAWGTRTKAANVINEAEKWITIIHSAVKKGAVAGYSPRRLAWLCEGVVELRDELAASLSKDGTEARGARASAMQVALRARKDLLGRLRLVAAGRRDLQDIISDRDEGTESPHNVRDTLTGLIDLAGRWRKDPTLLLLADDADLGDARLSAGYNALTCLSRANEATWDVATSDRDSTTVNRIEGRVLREMGHARHAFGHARELDRAVPNLNPGPSIRSVLVGDRDKPADKPAPRPAPELPDEPP